MCDACLIVVDVQNDFMPGGALAVPRGDEVVAVVNRMAPQFDWVILTQDWHAGRRRCARAPTPCAFSRNALAR